MALCSSAPLTSLCMRTGTPFLFGNILLLLLRIYLWDLNIKKIMCVMCIYNCGLSIWLNTMFNHFLPSNDIALIKLESSVNFSDTVMASCLPEAEFVLPNNESCYITGWGRLFSECPFFLREAFFNSIHPIKTSQIIISWHNLLCKLSLSLFFPLEGKTIRMFLISWFFLVSS